MSTYELVDPTIRDPAKMAKGRCPYCRVKPIVYKRDRGPGHSAGHFCARCDRKYDLISGEQIENWAYRRVGDGFQSTQRRKVYGARNPIASDQR